MLFGGTAASLQDGPLEIIGGQKVRYRKLLGCHLRFPHQQRDRRTGHWVRAQLHASAVLLKRSTNASGSSCGPIFISGTWAMDVAATGPSSRLSKLRSTRRSSFCAWTNTRKRSSCYCFRSISAWCWVWGRPVSDFTSSASGMGWADCMVACRLPRPGFRHQCNAVRRSGRRRWEPANVHFIKINKHKRKTAAPHGWLPHTKHKLKSRPGPLSPFTVVTPPFIPPKLLRGTRDRWVEQVSFIIIYSTGLALFPWLSTPPHSSQLLTVIIITYF